MANVSLTDRGGVLELKSPDTDARSGKRFRAPIAKSELIVRRQGSDRVFTISRRTQPAVASVAVACVTALSLAAGSLFVGQHEMDAERDLLRQQEAEVASAQSRISAYRGELDDATRQLEKRQAFLEEMVEMLPADLLEQTADGQNEGDSEAAPPEKVSSKLPEAVKLSKIERRQFETVSRLTRFAKFRADRAETAIRRLGLVPSQIASAPITGVGGPLDSLETEADGSLDPRFRELGESLARMVALEQGLAGVPQVMPTDLARMTSYFGYRNDPFTGEAALHSGLDFGGSSGDPIHAAATGKVSFVGLRGGYGKVVEVTHGNGLLTRYAHMSAWKAKVGQKVQAGDVLGAIGSTGRSTGPHLHFEVRVGGRAVNPRPFLENAPGVIAELRSRD